jgi:hypothetical protein
MSDRRSANGSSDAQAMVGEVIGRTAGADLVRIDSSSGRTVTASAIVALQAWRSA